MEVEDRYRINGILEFKDLKDAPPTQFHPAILTGEGILISPHVKSLITFLAQLKTVYFFTKPILTIISILIVTLRFF